MSRAERLKEELGWLKVVFGASLAVDISVIAWVAQNYQRASAAILIAAFVAIIVVTMILFFVNRLAYKRLEQLEYCK